MFPVGNCPIAAVDSGLEFIKDKPDGLITALVDGSEFFICIGKRGVFTKTVISERTAFNPDENAFRTGFLHESSQVPGFTKTGIFIKKEILAVKEVKYRVTLFRLLVIPERLTDIDAAIEIGAQTGNRHMPLFDHQK